MRPDQERHRQDRIVITNPGGLPVATPSTKSHCECEAYHRGQEEEQSRSTPAFDLPALARMRATALASAKQGMKKGHGANLKPEKARPNSPDRNITETVRIAEGSTPR